MNYDDEYGSQEDLIERLTSSVGGERRSIVFLVGSPASHYNSRGVPAVAEVIHLIQEELRYSEFEAAIAGALRPYQTAFEILAKRRSADVPNHIVRFAVLKARLRDRLTMSEAASLSDEQCKALDLDYGGWYLPPGTEYLTRTVQQFPESFPRILTTNFDPLLEAGLWSADPSHPPLRTVMEKDGSLEQTYGHGCHVVHLHGYWWGPKDTIHTATELLQPRPHLVDSLASLLRNEIVVTVAYGGWDDVFTQALNNVLISYESHPEVIWTFYENDTSAIAAHSSDLLQRLTIGGRRVGKYYGIDAHSFFPSLWRNLQRLTRRPRPLITYPSGLEIHGTTAIPLNCDSIGHMPFDVGTVLGLDRSSFVALIGGSSYDRIYDTLVGAEQLLSKAKGNTGLPARTWSQMQASSLSSLDPQLCTDSSGTWTLPGTLLRYICPQPSADFEDDIVRWCLKVMDTTLTSSAGALVMHVDQIAPKVAAPILARAAKRLMAVREGVPVYALGMWTTFAENSPEDMAYVRSFPFLEIAGASQDRLALAMLRQVLLDRDGEANRAHFESIEPFLSAALKAVGQLVLHKVDEATFLAKYGEREYRLAVLLGFEWQIPSDAVESFDLDFPDGWWLLRAIPMNYSRLEYILKHAAAYRAIFGLCTSAEWETIRQKDTEAARRIVTCRRNRLHFGFGSVREI
jgi:hypothetical protein